MAIPLTELQVLALDCQSTGANPRSGHLLEIGWVQTSAGAAFNPEKLRAKSFLVRLRQDVEIPPAVQRVTGLSKALMEKSMAAAEIWRELIQNAGRVAAADHMDTCPVIIHYARFEKPFLKDLQANEHYPDTFPFRIICTHEIAKRLLPGLPRKGLRAVAGYFGHTVPQQRRSADHAVGTAVIWRHFVEQLTATHGIDHLDQLTDWLRCTTPQSRIRRVFPMKREQRLNLPDKPGVYRMLRSNDDLLYIGKAASLKQRVNSYFRQKGPRAEHTLEMLSQAAKLDVTSTGSALEAALLESDEIKRHCPPYNVALQQGKRKLVFCSKNLRSCSPHPDKLHRIGPLPEAITGPALTAFAVWHANSQATAEDDLVKIGYAILGMPQAYAPQPDCLLEGLALFRQNHLTRWRQPCPLRVLTGLGFALWRQRLAALEIARAQEAEPVDQDAESEEAPSWTPETVARGVEKFAMRGAHLIRRARWLCLLSESSLAWEARNAKDRRKIVLQFENGAIGRRDELPIDKETPLSVRYRKRLAARQKIFDLTTYERLRVVTTELRRLVNEGRKIEIRIGPNASLGRKQLTRILPWV